VSLDASAIPDPPGGAGRYVLELAGALSRRHDVDLTVVTRTADAARWPKPVAARAPALRPVRLGWEQVGLPRIVRDLGVQVHHGPHYTAPRALGRPSVVTIHDLSFFTHPEWHQRTKVAFFRAAIRTSARHAAALVAVSATTATLLEQRVRPRAPVHVIPHGVDHARYRPDGPDDVAGVTAPYIAFVGTLEPRKDVPTLVRAFDRIAASRPDLTLVLAGARGWGGDAVDAAMGAARHGHRVRMTGYLPEGQLPALLRGAAAVAYPSLEEGFGLTALEALACGAPLVTTTGSAMEEVAGDAALLVTPGDTSALAAALDRVVRGDPDLAERRARGLARAAGASWAVAAAGHVAAYRAARDGHR